MPTNPLVEVFGYNATDMSLEAVRHREGRLCPFHNSSGLNCTKDSKTDPLGVCTVSHKGAPAITCPVRFRQDMLIVTDAARFFFPPNTRYLALTEVRLNDKNGKSAGNIDMVLVALDDNDEIADFGALEVQAVYVSGNVKKPFKHYMSDPEAHANMEWPALGYPKPDYLSSSRKRLAPQLIFKGGILNNWGKKMAVAVHTPFFEQLPTLPEVSPASAEIAWLTYDLNLDAVNNRYRLESTRTYYTSFREALSAITIADAGDVNTFIKTLAERIKRGKIMGTPPASELPPDVEPPLGLIEEQDADTEGF
ncbi:MAG: hypothetical protein KME12_22175 [Trichocoleus desertorum ATA4-8-CV12]|jgi:hypothetical protein|nr:hypothetical protein [Trichocoleus desertorum ATA4-8-CV12]